MQRFLIDTVIFSALFYSALGDHPAVIECAQTLWAQWQAQAANLPKPSGLNDPFMRSERQSELLTIGLGVGVVLCAFACGVLAGVASKGKGKRREARTRQRA